MFWGSTAQSFSLLSRRACPLAHLLDHWGGQYPSSTAPQLPSSQRSSLKCCFLPVIPTCAHLPSSHFHSLSTELLIRSKTDWFEFCLLCLTCPPRSVNKEWNKQMSEHKRRNTHNTESYPRAFRESGTGWFIVEVIRVRHSSENTSTFYYS